jgi:CDP-glucose 4,6-dehydratase
MGKDRKRLKSESNTLLSRVAQPPCEALTPDERYSMVERNLFGGLLKGRTVLITGHTGFKGSWLGIWLKLLGANVIGYSRDPAIERKQRNFLVCHLEDRITHSVGDIRDLDPLIRIIERYNPEVVIHMAAQPLVKVSYQEAKRTFDTNVGGTVNVLEAIRQTKSVKVFIGVTTDKVYEDQQWVWGYRENDPLGGYDPYSASKAMVELCVQSYRRSWSEKWTEGTDEKSFSDHAVLIASARSGNVIGGGDFSKHRLVPDCMRALMDGQSIHLRNPDAVRPWQYVLEPLSGYLWLAANLLQEQADDFSEAWNFGPSEHQEIACEAVVRKAIEFWESGGYELATAGASRRHETFTLKLNWAKAATRLGWRPTYNWEQALKATVDWFKEYQRQGGGSGSAPDRIDMYDLCCDQIKHYTVLASDHAIEWAHACPRIAV